MNIIISSKERISRLFSFSFKPFFKVKKEVPLVEAKTSDENLCRQVAIVVSGSSTQSSIDKIFEQPNWVKYQVRDIEKNADRDGMNFFKVDSVHTSDDNDYYNNRWDRGHMAPAGSFNDSYSNLLATFSYLNVALQYDDLKRLTSFEFNFF